MAFVKYIMYGLIFCVLTILTGQICFHSVKADIYQCQILEKMKPLERIKTLLDFSADHKKELQNLIDDYFYHLKQTKVDSFIMIVLSSLIFGLSLIYDLRVNSDTSRLLFIRWSMLLTLFFLVIGIIAPFLKVIVSKEMGIFGPFVFKYNTKSIATTINHLSKKNIFLCLMIFICSIIIPVCKLFLTYITTHGPNELFKKRSEKILKVIGKWAMTDVFVVAILLTFLSMDGSNATQCTLEWGFYFFSAYCVLSYLITFFIKKNEYLVENISKA